jgi:hypothetical protein
MDIVYQSCFIVYALGAVYGMCRTAQWTLSRGTPSIGDGYVIVMCGAVWPLVIIWEWVYDDNKPRY